jgi:hypothetical protein
MASRYFISEDSGVPAKSGKTEEVYSISKEIVEKVKKKRTYAETANNKFGAQVKRKRSWKKKPDQFPGPAPIDPEKLEKHSRGDGVNTKRIRTKYGQTMAKRREETMHGVQETAAR